ncbi:orotidine-5'-phosphate decarboxylase [soil metagenome]
MFDTSTPQAAAEPDPLPVPIVALDVSGAREAMALVERLPRADFFKVGLQLFSTAGPLVVRELRQMGRRVFLDLKLHDIPNTVAGAVEAAAEMDVQLLTVHAAGGSAMMRAARSAAGARAGGGPELMAVTVLTSLSPEELAETWGRDSLQAPVEAARLSCLAAEAEMDGVVTSVHEVSAIRALTEGSLKVLTPGIRFSDGAAGDQTRVATPADAAALAVEYLVIGRAVTAASDPGAAFERLLRELEQSE